MRRVREKKWKMMLHLKIAGERVCRVANANYSRIMAAYIIVNYNSIICRKYLRAINNIAIVLVFSQTHFMRPYVFSTSANNQLIIRLPRTPGPQPRAAYFS